MNEHRSFRLTALALCLMMLCSCAPTPAEGSGAGSSPAEQPAVQTVTTYPFMEGTAEENTVTVIDSGKSGPCMYIVGGIHGDEIAGWQAAERLKSGLPLKCGTVYILSPVNRSGAAAETRFVGNSGDLNRAFPGDAASEDMAHRLAAALYAEIQRVNPDFVLDLHEARWELGTGSTYAGLGNTIIYTDDSKISELLFDFTLANESGELLDRTFALTAPGVAGSFNRVISERLGIPVITTETWRKLEVEHRIGHQLEIINFCLNYYGMIELPEN